MPKSWSCYCIIYIKKNSVGRFHQEFKETIVNCYHSGQPVDAQGKEYGISFVFWYIEVFYNRKRIRQNLVHLTPNQFDVLTT